MKPRANATQPPEPNVARSFLAAHAVVTRLSGLHVGQVEATSVACEATGPDHRPESGSIRVGSGPDSTSAGSPTRSCRGSDKKITATLSSGCAVAVGFSPRTCTPLVSTPRSVRIACARSMSGTTSSRPFEVVVVGKVEPELVASERLGPIEVRDRNHHYLDGPGHLIACVHVANRPTGERRGVATETPMTSNGR